MNITKKNIAVLVAVIMLMSIMFVFCSCSSKDDLVVNNSIEEVDGFQQAEKNAEIIGVTKSLAEITTNENAETTGETDLLDSKKSFNERGSMGSQSIVGEQGQNSTDAAYGVLSQSLSEHLIDEFDDCQSFDLSSLNLKATIESDQLINEVMRTLIPSFNPIDYVITKTAQNTNKGTGDFIVDYNMKVGEYVSDKGYSISYSNNKAFLITESRVSLSVPSIDANKLPAVTEQIIQSAYQQGQEKVQSMNSDYVVLEQKGFAFYDLMTNGCFYKVTTVYDVGSGARGAISTQYTIS